MVGCAPRLTARHDRRVHTAERELPVEATLTPAYDKHSRTSLGVLSMEVHQVFGTWRGWLVTEAGERVEFDGLVGWAEEARNRW